MQNITTKLLADGKTLQINVDLTKPICATKGGKGVVLGRSVGFRSLPEHPGIAFTAMVYQKGRTMPEGVPAEAVAA